MSKVQFHNTENASVPFNAPELTVESLHNAVDVIEAYIAELESALETEKVKHKKATEYIAKLKAEAIHYHQRLFEAREELRAIRHAVCSLGNAVLTRRDGFVMPIFLTDATLPRVRLYEPYAVARAFYSVEPHALVNHTGETDEYVYTGRRDVFGRLIYEQAD